MHPAVKKTIIWAGGFIVPISAAVAGELIATETDRLGQMVHLLGDIDGAD